MKISVVSGGFDPIHSGHIAYLKEAANFGDKLYVCLNSDQWLKSKKGKPFMDFNERYTIISSLKFVDQVIAFDDSDGSCIKGLQEIQHLNPDAEIIFCNGGDRNEKNIPEMALKSISFKFGVGGNNKINSSSWILNNWQEKKVKRFWGSYKVLDQGELWQVKELIFEAGKSLSDQRHFLRSEHWHVVSGKIEMHLETPDGKKIHKKLECGDSIDIPINTWHKATNTTIEPAHIIEVWMGDKLTESDIERRDTNN